MNKRYEDGVVSEEALRLRSAIAGQMKSVRLSCNMTQQKLADLSGTKKSNISRMESGSYNPSLDFLVKVAGCMGKTVEIKID